MNETVKKVDEKRLNATERVIKALREGKSWLQQPNEKPDYTINPLNSDGKQVFTGIRQIDVSQALYEKGNSSHRVISAQQIDDKELFWPKGKEHKDSFVTYVEYINKNKVGKKNADGTPMRDKEFQALYFAESFRLPRFEKKKDKYGNDVHYDTDIYFYDGDKVKTFKFDTEKHKAGEPIVMHRKGAIIWDKYVTDEYVFDPVKESSEVPAIAQNGELHKRIDDSAKEIIEEKFGEAFRGKLSGNYEGLKITKKELDIIEKELKDHPRIFEGYLNNAWTYGMGNQEAIVQMQQRQIAKKELELQNDNSNVKSKSR